ncbi:MAG: CD1845 family protein [Blautia wexlerae]
MRLIGKLLALPFMLVTGILYLVCKFLVVLFGAVLGILSGIIFLAALVLFFVAGFLPGLAWLMIAFLISPYGLPLAVCMAGRDHWRGKQCLKGFYIWLSRFGGAHRRPRSFSAIITSLIGIKLRR